MHPTASRSLYPSALRRAAALTALVAAIVFAGCTEPGADDDDPDVGVSARAPLPTCLDVVQGVRGGVVDDTFVSALAPNTNFDNSPFGMFVRAGNRGATILVRPRLDRIPADARVESARLRMFTLLATAPHLELLAHRVTAPWSEHGVTSASFHDAFEAAGVAGVQLDPVGPYRFDLTALVAGWLRGASANHGVAITVAAGLGIFVDDHATSIAWQPTLTVCYTTCSDQVRNGDETGVDCGGATCGACVVDADGDGTPATADCDDHAAAVHPGAAELCNLVDDDCDGQVDDGNPGSGGACNVASGELGTLQCQAGMLTCVATAERCDGLDNDGDGVIDDGNPGAYIDCSHDVSFNPGDPTEIGGRFYGYTSCAAGHVECLPVDQLEACDGVDNDHDGLVDEAGVLCRDDDGDGDGSPLHQLVGCGPVAGYAATCSDCDDTRPEVNRDGALEACESTDIYADNNCDGNFDRNRNECV